MGAEFTKLNITLQRPQEDQAGGSRHEQAEQELDKAVERVEEGSSSLEFC